MAIVNMRQRPQVEIWMPLKFGMQDSYAWHVEDTGGCFWSLRNRIDYANAICRVARREIAMPSHAGGCLFDHFEGWPVTLNCVDLLLERLSGHRPQIGRASCRERV